MVVQRQGSKGTFTLKMEPNILEPVAWPALSCSWPNVELRAEMQHQHWGKGKMDLLVLPFSATCNPHVWMVYV